MQFISLYHSPIGEITLASDGDSITGLWIVGQKYHGKVCNAKLVKKSQLPAFNIAFDWLDRYFAGKQPSISALPLAPSGSDFRQNVWNILREIPYGKLITYGSIAKQIAKQMNVATMSSQAIGGAVGHNPISIIIPCHRVVGSNGSLTGYAGDIATKIKLLELEGADISCLFVPK